MRPPALAFATASLALAAIMFAPAGATDVSAAITFRVDPIDSTLWLGSDRAALHLDRWMNAEVFSIRGAESLAVTATLPGGVGASPPYSFTSGTTDIGDFVLSSFASQIHVAPVSSPFFGNGLRLTLTASSASQPVLRALEFAMYDSHPDAIVTRATYTNQGTSPLPVTRLRNDRLILDLRRANPGSSPHGFLAVQPTIDAWGRNWVGVALTPSYSRVNPMMGGSVLGRGGMPFMDLWGPSTGIAVASLEPVPRALEFPCRVLPDGRVEIAIEVAAASAFGQVPLTLAPAGMLAGPRTAIIAHRGDFHEAAHRYGRLLDAALSESGRAIPGPYPESAYAPYWKTWGLGMDFTTTEIYDRLDGLADLGFEMIGLDDGWFDTYGGWNPDAVKFPGGDAAITAFIGELHDAQWGAGGNRSFRVLLWWNPTGWETASGLSSSLRIRAAGGGYPVDSRGNNYLCPAYAPAVTAVTSMVDRFLGAWDADALYMDGDGLLAVPPCYNAVHGHARPAESCEKLPDLYRAIKERARLHRPDDCLILCECSTPHDPYKMAYYDHEDASDPITDPMVRWKVKFMKALRGGTAPVGDGYIDPMSYNDLSGTFANGLGVGAVLTSMYDTQLQLGASTWATWSALNETSGASRAEYRNHYNLGFEFPEAHVLAREDGSFVFSFYSTTQWAAPVTLRGLVPGVGYDLSELDTGAPRGAVTGPTATVQIPFHRQAPGMPWWLLLVARPAGVTSAVNDEGDGRSVTGAASVASLVASPNPGRGAIRLAFHLPGSRDADLHGARLEIFDLAGRRVRELAMSSMGDPSSAVVWNGRDDLHRPVAPGVYFARLTWTGGTITRRIVLVR